MSKSYGKNQSTRWLALLCTTAASWAVCAVMPGQLARGAEVVLDNGQTLTAAIDPKTNDERLWLRFEAESMTILRPVPWPHVESLVIDGRAIAPENQVQAAIAGAEPAVARLHRAPAPTQLPPTTPNGSPTADRPTIAALAGQALGLSERVVAAEAHAYLANWDSDVEADGLVVEVLAISTSGHAIPLDGTVDVRLYSIARASDSTPTTARRLGRWVRTFTSADVRASGVSMRLPFQGVHPSFDTRVAPHGLVHVRLNVPGHGTFETSVTDVRVRPYSAVRDSLEQRTGHRFLPLERHGKRP